MNDFLIILHYSESDWGDDLVRFRVPASFTFSSLIDELECQKCDLDPSGYDSLQDYAEELCNRAATVVGGTWEYVRLNGTVDITFD